MKRSIPLAAILLSLSAHAGVFVESVRLDAAGKEISGQTMWVQNGMARVESRTSTAIFKNDVFYTLDNAKKKYMAMDRATMEQSMTRVNDMLEQMRAKSANLPPEQRAMLDQMAKQLGGTSDPKQRAPVYDAQPAGGSDTVNGRSCKLWNITRDGQPTQQLCVASFSSLPGADEVASVSKKMLALFEKMGDRFREQVSLGMQQQSATLAKIDGYPIMSRTYHDGKLSPESFIVKAWEQRSLDANKFEIPKDFVKQEMPQFPGPAGK